MSYNRDEAMRLVQVVSKTPPGRWHVELGGFIYAGNRRKIADAGYAATVDERTNNAYAIASIPDLASQLAAAVAEIDRLTNALVERQAHYADAIAKIDRLTTELQERNTNEL